MTHDDPPPSPPLPGDLAAAGDTGRTAAPASPGVPVLPPTAADAPVRRRWYHSWFVVLLLLATCGPVGLMVLWTGPFRTSAKVLLTLATGAVAALALTLSAGSSSLTRQVEEAGRLGDLLTPTTAAVAPGPGPTTPTDLLWETLGPAGQTSVCRLVRDGSTAAAVDLLTAASSDPAARAEAEVVLRRSC